MFCDCYDYMKTRLKIRSKTGRKIAKSVTIRTFKICGQLSKLKVNFGINQVKTPKNFPQKHCYIMAINRFITFPEHVHAIRYLGGLPCPFLRRVYLLNHISQSGETIKI